MSEWPYDEHVPDIMEQACSPLRLDWNRTSDYWKDVMAKQKKSSYTPLKEGPMHIYMYDGYRNSTHPLGSKERFMDKWIKREVVGQTSRSWVLAGTPAIRIPLDRSKQSGICMSLYEIDVLWVMQCLKPQIIDRIEVLSRPTSKDAVSNYSLLLSVAETLGIPTHPVSKR